MRKIIILLSWIIFIFCQGALATTPDMSAVLSAANPTLSDIPTLSDHQWCDMAGHWSGTTKIRGSQKCTYQVDGDIVGNNKRYAAKLHLRRISGNSNFCPHYYHENFNIHCHLSLLTARAAGISMSGDLSNENRALYMQGTISHNQVTLSLQKTSP